MNHPYCTFNRALLIFASTALLFSASVIPTGVAGFFFRAVCGAPATKWRDRGNRCPISRLDGNTRSTWPPAICSRLSCYPLSLIPTCPTPILPLN